MEGCKNVQQPAMKQERGDAIIIDKEAEYSDTSRSSQSSDFPPPATSTTSIVSPPSSKYSMTTTVDIEGTEQGELPARCQLCNKATASVKSFLSIPCKHKYCFLCASMVNKEQHCMLCSAADPSEFELTRLTPTSPRSAHDTTHITTALPIYMRPPHSDMTSQVSAVEPACSISNPLALETRSNQSIYKYRLPQLLEGGTQCLASSRRASPHINPRPLHLSMPPPLMAQPLSWCVPPVAEGHSNTQTLERNLHKCTMCDEVLPTSDVFKLDNAEGETCRAHYAALLCKCTTSGGMGLCCKCMLEHAKHPLIPHEDVRTAVLMLIAGSKLDQKNVEDAIETVRRMSERMEASVQSVKREVCSVIDIHINALEERKRDLLKKVDTLGQSKMSALKAQGERLAQRRTSLNDALKSAEANTTTSGESSEIHLRSTFDLLMAVHRGQNVQLLPNESDLLKFIPPDNSLITRLRNLGEMDSGACARTTHVIGENFKRAIADKMITIEVQTRDACGDASNSSNNELTASLTAPDGRSLHVYIAERHGGVYALSYCPVEEGSHVLDIMVRGVSISGCPAVVHVRKGRNYASLARTGPLFSFACQGSGDGEVCRPWGICCDNKGRILLADRSNNRVQIFDKNGTFVMKFGTRGARSGQFNRPAGIAVNSMDEIVVADKDNHRIQVFSEKGEFLLQFGKPGRTPGMFSYPWGVAVNAHNHIAVSDTRNHRVQIFSPRGLYIGKCGFASSSYYKILDSPRGVCFLPDGHLVITDFNNHRLAVVSSLGPTEMKCFGMQGDGDGFFCRPQGVAIDKEGHILICDSRNNRVQVLCAEDMRCIATFGGAPPVGSMAARLSPPSEIEPVTLDRPTDICVSPEGLIYVVDFGSNCIRVY